MKESNNNNNNNKIYPRNFDSMAKSECASRKEETKESKFRKNFLLMEIMFRAEAVCIEDV